MCVIQIRGRFSSNAHRRKRYSTGRFFEETAESRSTGRLSVKSRARSPLATSLDGAAVIQAGQSSRPPRWQQWRRRVSAQCVVRQTTTSGSSVGSGSSSRSRRFTASFRYGPSDNAPSLRRGTKQAAIFGAEWSPPPPPSRRTATVPSDRSSRSSPAMHRAHRARDGALIDARSWA